MGKRFIQHSDMCGCERCAIQAEMDEPRPVFDEIEDPEIMDCGCSVWQGCNCGYDDGPDFEEDE